LTGLCVSVCVTGVYFKLTGRKADKGRMKHLPQKEESVYRIVFSTPYSDEVSFSY
jgi:hypothetical protein